MKNIYRIIPLLYFTGLGFFWIAENLMSTGTVNYVAIVVTLFIMAQFFYKNKVAGLATGIVMGLFSFYMLIAMLDDVTDSYSEPNYRFIAFGGGLFGTGIVMATLLIAYHAKMKTVNALSGL